LVVCKYCILDTKEPKNQEPNMLPPTCRATPAFGSGQRTGTELSPALGMSRYRTKLNELSGSP
jgi:hypothetical protein